MHTLEKAVRKGRISRSDLRHYKGIVYLQQGLQLLQAPARWKARMFAARKCIKELPAYAPCALRRLCCPQSTGQ